MPNGNRVVCGCTAVREDDGADWLDFLLPLGALGRANPQVGAFPFGDDGGEASLAWRHPIDPWLASIGARVYERVAFELGLIGFEASG